MQWEQRFPRMLHFTHGSSVTEDLLQLPKSSTKWCSIPGAWRTKHLITAIYPTSQSHKHPSSTGLDKQQIQNSEWYWWDKIIHPSKSIQWNSIKAHIKSSNFRTLKKLNAQMPESKWVARQQSCREWSGKWHGSHLKRKSGVGTLLQSTMCIYRNIAHKVCETVIPPCKEPGSSQSTVHTAPPARSWVQQQGQHDAWKTALCKKLNQASLVQKAKGGRRMPGSNGCDYGHFLAWNYLHREEQFCDVKSCSEDSSGQLFPMLLGAGQ